MVDDRVKIESGICSSIQDRAERLGVYNLINCKCGNYNAYAIIRNGGITIVIIVFMLIISCVYIKCTFGKIKKVEKSSDKKVVVADRVE